MILEIFYQFYIIVSSIKIVDFCGTCFMNKNNLSKRLNGLEIKWEINAKYKTSSILNIYPNAMHNIIKLILTLHIFHRAIQATRGYTTVLHMIFFILFPLICFQCNGF